MPIVTKSELATQVSKPRDVADRTALVHGLAVHTTGSGIVDLARKKKIDPFECAVTFYLNPDNYFPHYVVGYDGQIVQICDEKERAQHIGFKERAVYLDGSWVKVLPPAVVALWRSRWSGVKSPAHLFPGTSPNNVYCGVELIPVADDLYGMSDLAKSTWLSWHKTTGLRYTLAQHQAVVLLARDIAERHALPTDWQHTGRFCTHEDINPIARHTKKPPACWDPGVLREKPWFDWDFAKSLID
jgi:hypothetical protein